MSPSLRWRSPQNRTKIISFHNRFLVPQKAQKAQKYYLLRKYLVGRFSRVIFRRKTFLLFPLFLRDINKEVPLRGRNLPNFPNLTKFFLVPQRSASRRVTLATNGTQEIAEGLARRPEGESQIAEILFALQIFGMRNHSRHFSKGKHFCAFCAFCETFFSVRFLASRW